MNFIALEGSTGGRVLKLAIRFANFPRKDKDVTKSPAFDNMKQIMVI